jgi:hypothetical protein
MAKYMVMFEDGGLQSVEYNDDGSANLSRAEPQDDYYPALHAEWVAWDALEKQYLPVPEGPFIAPWSYPVAGLPDGTKAIIILPDGTPFVVLDLAQDLIFTTPGEYHLIIDPPLPTMGFTLNLVVTD